MRWLPGDAAGLSLIQVDLATVTGNVAQAIADHRDWEGLGAAYVQRVTFADRMPAAESL